MSHMKLIDRCDLNYGWSHFLYPFYKHRQLTKEYIKGPYTIPMLMCSHPYIALNKRDGSPLKLQNGIPDSWAEYLTYKCLPINKFLKPNMFKEDVLIARKMRKRYRLYLGQGIPDPYLFHTHKCRLDCSHQVDHQSNGSTISHQYTNKKVKKKGCLCCERKYLFECPDFDSDYDLKTVKNLNCPCEKCHPKLPKVSSEAYETCIRIHSFENENENAPTTVLREGNGQETNKRVIDLTGKTSQLRTEPKNESTGIKQSSDKVKSFHTGMEEKVRSVKLLPESRSGGSEKKVKICCCPCFKRKKKKMEPVKKETLPRSHMQMDSFILNSFIKPCKSKEFNSIDIQPLILRYSKSVQTDLMRHKPSKERKLCQCTDACILCNVTKCRGSVPPQAKIPHTLSPASNVLVQLPPGSHYHCSKECVARHPVTAYQVSKKESGNAENACTRNETRKCKTCNKGQQTDFKRERKKLKHNQKMYCCTFSSSTHEKRPDEKTDDSPDFKQNNKFAYHCTVPTFANFMTVPTPLKEKISGSDVPPFCSELKIPLRRASNHNWLGRHVEQSNVETSMTPSYKKVAVGPGTEGGDTNQMAIGCPLEIKFVNDLKSDESRTFGLIRDKTRRKGKRLKSSSSRKTSCQKLNGPLHQFHGKTGRSNKLIQVEPQSILEGRPYVDNKTVSFKSNNRYYTNLIDSFQQSEAYHPLSTKRTFTFLPGYHRRNRRNIETDMTGTQWTKFKHLANKSTLT